MELNHHLIEYSREQFHDLLVLIEEFQSLLKLQLKSFRKTNEMKQIMTDFLNSILTQEFVSHINMLQNSTQHLNLPSSSHEFENLKFKKNELKTRNLNFESSDKKSNLPDSFFSREAHLILLQDRVGRVSYVNPLINEFWGIRSELALGKTLDELIEELSFSEEIKTRLKQARESTASTSEVSHYNFHLSESDREIHYICTFHLIKEIETILCIITQLEVLGSNDLITKIHFNTDYTHHPEVQQKGFVERQELDEKKESESTSGLLLETENNCIVDLTESAANLFRRDRQELINRKLSRLDLLLSSRLKNALDYLQVGGQVKFRHSIYHRDLADVMIEVICQCATQENYVVVLFQVLDHER